MLIIEKPLTYFSINWKQLFEKPIFQFYTESKASYTTNLLCPVNLSLNFLPVPNDIIKPYNFAKIVNAKCLPIIKIMQN